MRSWWARSGLAVRIAVSAFVVGVGLALVFGVMFVAITGLRHRSLEARHSQQVIATANQLQTLVIDLETGVRGFAITRKPRYLAPWRSAGRQFPKSTRRLVALTTDNKMQHERAIRIKQAIERYYNDSVPIVDFLGRNPTFAPTVATAQPERQQVEHIRSQFAALLGSERALGEQRDERARVTARNALIVGGIGLGAALLLILLGALYVNRAVARPVREAAEAGESIARG